MAGISNSVTRAYIYDNIGEYVIIRLKTNNTQINSTFSYEGVLKNFIDDELILDNDICINYKDISRLLAIPIH